MKDIFKKIALWFAIVLFIAVITASTIWVVGNYDKVLASLQGANLYTSQQVEEAVEEARAEAITDEAGYISTINALSGNVDSLELQLTAKTSELADATTALTNALAQNSTDSTQIASLTAQVTTLTSEVTSLQISLQQTIDYYESLLAEVDLTDRFVAVFMNNDYIVGVRTAGTEEFLLDIPSIESTTYKEFLGWSIDGVNVLDLSAYAITSDVTFVAVIKTYYDVTFDSERGVVNQVIAENSYIQEEPSASIVNYTFLGWSTDGVNVLDLSAYAITSDVTFIAVYEGPLSIGDSGYNFLASDMLNGFYWYSRTNVTTQRNVEVSFDFYWDYVVGGLSYTEPQTIILNAANNYTYEFTAHFFDVISKTHYYVPITAVRTIDTDGDVEITITSTESDWNQTPSTWEHTIRIYYINFNYVD